MPINVRAQTFHIDPLGNVDAICELINILYRMHEAEI